MLCLVTQSYLTLCDPMDCNLPGSSVHEDSPTKNNEVGCSAPTWPLKWSESLSVVSDSLQPHGLYNPWNSPGQNTGVDSLSFLQGNLPNPGIELRSPALLTDSLSAESQGKPKNTGVGSLSLLQQIFPTQESNQGILHCRGILYQLSYEWSQLVDSS